MSSTETLETLKVFKTFRVWHGATHKAEFYTVALTGIRIPVLALKGPRPSPLDDEGREQRLL